jgi:hypothetical protein
VRVAEALEAARSGEEALHRWCQVHRLELEVACTASGPVSGAGARALHSAERRLEVMGERVDDEGAGRALWVGD